MSFEHACHRNETRIVEIHLEGELVQKLLVQQGKPTDAFSLPLYRDQHLNNEIDIKEIVLRIISQATLEEQASMFREIMMISRDIMEQQVLVVFNMTKIILTWQAFPK